MLENYVVKNPEGWWWPKHDGITGLNEIGSCWFGMQTYADVPQLIANHVPEKKVVVQAGGNCGFYVKKYAAMFDVVYTFEPDPLNFYCLNLNVTEPNVTKFQACLGAKHECVSMGNSVKDIGAIHVVGSGSVPTLRIDDLALDRVDLIHLDIEGYELNALNGAVDTIKRCKPVIALESYEPWAERYNSSLEKVDNFLKELGYEFSADERGDRVYKFSNKIKIYDCFPFFKEFDILELRLQELWDTVDYFVIAEATTTHSGLAKPLYLKDNWSRYEKYSSKIRHIIVDDMPKSSNPWHDENFQRNALQRGLYDLRPNDLVIVSDCDEIPRPEVVKELVDDDSGYDVYVLRNIMCNYRLNFLKIAPQNTYMQQNIIVTRGRSFKTPQYARDITFKRGEFPRGYHDNEIVVIEHGGWHFSYFGDTQFAIDKIKAFAHYRETDQPQYMNNISVDYMIQNKCALVGPRGEEKFEYIKVNEYYPKTILNNLEKYQQWIIPNAEYTVYDFYKP